MTLYRDYSLHIFCAADNKNVMLITMRALRLMILGGVSYLLFGIYMPYSLLVLQSN